MRLNLRLGNGLVLTALAAMATLAVPTLAAPGRGEVGERGEAARQAEHQRPGPGPRPGDPGRRGDPPRWWDGAHGHAHYYPTPGWSVRHPPPPSRTVVWAGVNYRYWDGVWYAPGSAGYVVVRPPYGVVVADLPAFRTLVTIGGLSYLYANGVYYRERREGGYEVVPTPVDGDAGPASASDKLFVYPRQGQAAAQQASDEYECHRWATGQTGFDPTAAAVGQPSGDATRRGDYQRARTACLEGRGYTVR